MKEKAAFLAVFSILLTSAFMPRFAAPVVPQQVPNQYHMVVATPGSPQTVDPAWAYWDSSAHALDDYSRQLIFNVYETLVFYDRECVDKFVPLLATEGWISDDGLTYTFRIRESVKFHNRENLTTKDIEYSFERLMVQDYWYGPAWMLYEPLLGCWEADLTDPAFGQKIDNAVQRNSTHVWLNLVKPHAPLLKILSQTWSSIVNKQFCVEHGDWPGTWNNWQDYHDPEFSPLDSTEYYVCTVCGYTVEREQPEKCPVCNAPKNKFEKAYSPQHVMCGTGPYMFDYWEEGVEWSIIKFDNYWGGWPAPRCRGYIERATVKTVKNWLDRKELFLLGDVDLAHAPRANIDEVFGESGIRCVYPLPELSCVGFFFNFNISLDSRWLKPPFSADLSYGELNEDGIPPDFFSDIDVRKGFAYSINYTEFTQTIYARLETIYPGTPAIEGIPYRNPDQMRYEFNLTKAEEHFREAYNGQLWETGFTLTLPYNEGMIPREVIIEMLKANVESLNPKFHIELVEIDCWPCTWYIPSLFTGRLSLYDINWIGSYPDPHDLLRPFIYSQGAYTPIQSYSNPYVDALFEEGATTMDPVRREEIFYELQQVYFDDCPSVILYQTLRRHWERTWVQGWYYNPAYPGLYFYLLWKEDLPPEDLNSDGTVDIFDVVHMSSAFGTFYDVGVLNPKWDSRADLVADQAIDIFDIVKIAKRFGYTAPTWTPL